MQKLSITLGVVENTIIDKHGVKHARIRFSPDSYFTASGQNHRFVKTSQRKLVLWHILRSEGY